jgi:hypothetical protein
MRVLPNVIYIGPDKAGSTWLFQLLSCHTDAFVTPAKDLYFFDRYYDKGIDWYAQQFDGGAGYRVVGEISHDYLYHRAAARRLRSVLPEVKLLVCLREPCARTFSAYLHLVKGGYFSGTFEAALEAHPGLVERSCYGKYISMYLDHFPREQLRCVVFDDLQHDAQHFASSVFQAVGLAPMQLPARLQQHVLPAGRSRSVLLTRTVKWAADLTRAGGMPKLIGRVKTSGLVQRLLYRPYNERKRPTPTPQTVTRLREMFLPDIAKLDEKLGTTFGRLWSYG